MALPSVDQDSRAAFIPTERRKRNRAPILGEVGQGKRFTPVTVGEETLGNRTRAGAKPNPVARHPKNTPLCTRCS
jgi:hypothetical protein